MLFRGGTRIAHEGMRSRLCKAIYRTCRLKVLFGIAVLLLICFCGARIARSQNACSSPSNMSIAIDPIHPDANSTVNFTVQPTGTVSHASISQESPLQVQSPDASCQIELDLSTMHRDKSGRFVFSLFANERRQFAQSAYSFLVYEDPSGAFNDTILPVNIRRVSANSPLMGSASIPVHSPYGPPNALSFVSGTGDSQAVHTVPMGTTDFPLTITLQSNLSQLGAALGPAQTDVTCGGCLHSPIPTQLSKNALAPNDRVDVTFKLTANTIPAMYASAHPLSQSADADLYLSIPVTPDQGGSPRSQEIGVHLKFSPPLPLMVLSILGGTIVGALLRVFIGWRANKKWEWEEFLMGVIYALLTWGIAIAVFNSGKTTVKIMDVQLDPTQLWSAGLLCLLAGGGPLLLKLADNGIVGKLKG